MKKTILTLAVFVMAICASAQKNQYFWYQGNLMLGNPIAQIDSVTFGTEDTDSILVYLPRTIIKTVHDTVYITIHDTVCPQEDISGNGVLTGEFSVSATEKVHFSQGNLQYQASTDTWRFAENQYDIIGNDNANISASYSGWIDLFGWGTGNNPTKSSTNYSDYSTFVDWGVNAISNGGNEANLWRTLTSDEWGYLFKTRTNAASLFGLGSVNGINGTIILPDNWSTPQAISFTPSTSQGLSDQGSYYYNENENNFYHNTYTAEQWSLMEAAGAVFLPAAGERYGTSVDYVGSYGYDWSAAPYFESSAYDMSFGWIYLFPQGNINRYYGRSVRLVR